MFIPTKYARSYSILSLLKIFYLFNLVQNQPEALGSADLHKRSL